MLYRRRRAVYAVDVLAKVLHRTEELAATRRQASEPAGGVGSVQKGRSLLLLLLRRRRRLLLLRWLQRRSSRATRLQEHRSLLGLLQQLGHTGGAVPRLLLARPLAPPARALPVLHRDAANCVTAQHVTPATSHVALLFIAVSA
jgi:hypothetical protein